MSEIHHPPPTTYLLWLFGWAGLSGWAGHHDILRINYESLNNNRLQIVKMSLCKDYLALPYWYEWETSAGTRTVQ